MNATGSKPEAISSAAMSPATDSGHTRLCARSAPNLPALRRAGRWSFEPVFGQVKEARGFRQFLLRGIEKVKAEWAMICTVHNLRKLALAAA